MAPSEPSSSISADRDWDGAVAQARAHPKAYVPRLSQRLRRWWSVHLRKQARSLGRHVLPPRLESTISAAQWARRWNPAWLRTVAPAFEGTLPQTPFHFPHPIFEAPDWKKGPYTLPPLFTLEIPYGRTVGARGAIITPDNCLIEDFSRFYHTPKHPILGTGLLPPAKPLSGRYAALSGPGNSTYHWLFDITTRFHILQEAGYRLGDFDGFLLRRPKYAAHYEMLDLIGIPQEKIVWCSGAKHFELEHLVVPSFSNHDAVHHPMGYRYLRGLMTPRPPGERRRFYLSRRDAPRASRRVANEAEVEAILGDYGCEPITVSHLSLMKQAHLFASAEMIVAPHGGGLANLCFAEAPVKVLEFFAPDYSPDYFRTISLQMGFRYEALAGETEGSGEMIGNDIRIDPDQLRAVMEAFAKG